MELTVPQLEFAVKSHPHVTEVGPLEGDGAGMQPLWKGLVLI